MRFVDEFRDPDIAKRIAERIHRTLTRPLTLMEVCGGQTHSIVRFGLQELLPDTIHLLHGPGCPVCVTPVELIDKAMEIARRPEVVFCSFGDMLRVPGTRGDLLSAKSAGADVRVVYSPMDALKTARENPSREIVFFAVGFETTAPANAMAVLQAHTGRVKNFSVLVAHVLVPPAMETILRGGTRVEAFLAAGHVCTVTGFADYERMIAQYRVPIVITGFEPTDILQGILLCVRQHENGEARVENPYARAVRPPGNPLAQELCREVFRVVDRNWRGIGAIPQSGFALQPRYARHDAEQRFGGVMDTPRDTSGCLSGLVLQGRLRPVDCPAFGKRCTPQHPLGATMVSPEGACAAYYRYPP
jgi:hydrogenase expression/formation protein HypD